MPTININRSLLNIECWSYEGFHMECAIVFELIPDVRPISMRIITQQSLKRWGLVLCSIDVPHHSSCLIAAHATCMSSCFGLRDDCHQVIVWCCNHDEVDDCGLFSTPSTNERRNRQLPLSIKIATAYQMTMRLYVVRK